MPARDLVQGSRGICPTKSAGDDSVTFEEDDLRSIGSKSRCAIAKRPEGKPPVAQAREIAKTVMEFPRKIYHFINISLCFF
jgi:hypothetical protein